MAINEYAFNNKHLEGRIIFKPKDKPLSSILVTEEFKEIVENNDLKGLKFIKVC